MIAAMIQSVQEDPRRDRWALLDLPTEPIPIEYGPACEAPRLSAITERGAHKGRPIPFPQGEDPEHVKMVREKIPKQLAHLEGFFSKKDADTLPPSRPGFDVKLELERPPPVTGPPSYRTPYKYILLEKAAVDRLLGLGFIEPCMQPDAAPVLFAPKPYLPCHAWARATGGPCMESLYLGPARHSPP
jgi:hypothetical protein